MNYSRSLQFVIRLVMALLVASLSAVAQQVSSAAIAAAGTSPVPQLVNYNGVLKNGDGKSVTAVTGVTFLIYKDETGGAPLWLETQSIQPDATGHYVVQLGAASPHGLPAEIFINGEARWLAVQPSGGAEQPRALLVAVPYAMKASDSETLGGLPPSAFVLAAPPSGGSKIGPAADTTGTVLPPASTVTTTGGTVNQLPLWTTATNVQSSVITQTGSGATAKIGIGTATPAVTLDVKGAGTIRGTLTLPSTGTSTAAAGDKSQPLSFVASSFSSSTSTAVNQKFQWQAEPVANDTANPLGTLNLLYGLGTATPAETGLKINTKGIITFASGQIFPGTGPGTITGITTTSGSGLAGGGTAGTLNLSVPAAGISNAMLVHPSLTLTAGTDLTGGGTIALGGSTTLKLDTTKVPQLTANNNFTGNLNISGTLGVGTTTPAQKVEVDSGNLLVRGVGNFTTAGNTAFLYVGDTNHPIEALYNNGLAIGAFKVPSALFIQDKTGAVGIGTTTPAATLDVRGAGNFSNGVNALSSSIGQSALSGSNSSTSGSGTNGVSGITSSPAGTGTVGLNTSSGGFGLYGEADGDADGSTGVYGVARNTTGTNFQFGVSGQAYSLNGVGVFGQNGTQSLTAEDFMGFGKGVWGDGGTAGANYGVLGSVDNGYGGFFVNNSTDFIALEAINNGSGWSFAAFNNISGGGCYIDGDGDLTCNGTVTGTAFVTSPDGLRKVGLSAVESPQNWFEDAGASNLVNGSAVVALDPQFMQTVNTELEYHVFLTPKGDCKGLYIGQQTPHSFEVHELGGGTSSIRFDYRIMALRRKYEKVRFADHTNDPDPAKQMLRRAHSAKRPLGPLLEPLPQKASALLHPAGGQRAGNEGQK